MPGRRSLAAVKINAHLPHQLPAVERCILLVREHALASVQVFRSIDSQCVVGFPKGNNEAYDRGLVTGAPKADPRVRHGYLMILVRSCALHSRCHTLVCCNGTTFP